MLRVYPPPNTNNTASARSREAPCRLSAPSLACLFLGIFFIVQQGTHDELVAVDGLYRRFVVERKQAAGWKV